MHGVLEDEDHPDIPITGFIDLLLERDEGFWLAIDYKIEPKPPSGSFQERIHKMRLFAYSWLLKEQYNRDVSKCAIGYLYPNPEVTEFAPDPKIFASELSDTLKSLNLDPEKGLEANPKSGPTGNCRLLPRFHSLDSRR